MTNKDSEGSNGYSENQHSNQRQSYLNNSELYDGKLASKQKSSKTRILDELKKQCSPSKILPYVMILLIGVLMILRGTIWGDHDLPADNRKQQYSVSMVTPKPAKSARRQWRSRNTVDSAQTTSSTENNRHNYTDAWYNTNSEELGTPNNMLKIPIRHPVILVPGMGGNKLEVKENNGNWKHVWMNQQKILLNMDYMVKSLSLKYDSKTKTSYNNTGFMVRTKEFGKSSATDFLDETLFSKLIYKMKEGKADYSIDLKQGLGKLGYNLPSEFRSAPYDFRLSTRNQKSFMQKLKLLIEDTYMKNENRKIILMSHSMGGLMCYEFLKNLNSTWKNKYIHTFMPVNTPWLGSLYALSVFMHGDNMGVPIFNSLKMRSLVKTWESLIENFPRNLNSKRVIIESLKRNYTDADIRDFIKLLDPGFAIDQYDATRSQYKTMEHPKVHVVCLYSLSNEPKTPTKLIFEKTDDFPFGKPIIVNGKGDKQVEYESLTYACDHWSKNSRYGGMVKQVEMSPTFHIKALSNRKVVQLVDYLNRIKREEYDP